MRRASSVQVARSSTTAVIASALAWVMALSPALTSAAATRSARVTEGPQPAAAPAAAGAEAGHPADALASGDLTSARELATARREAAPTPENWKLEAEVCQQQTDHACALTSWRGYLDALPQDAAPELRADAERQIEAIEEAARGRVEDEPASTHRERLDRERAERIAAANPKPPPPEPIAQPKQPVDVQIHKKWYFWVVVTTLVATAAAITGIAVKAALDEQPDDLDMTNGSARVPLGGAQGLGFRF